MQRTTNPARPAPRPAGFSTSILAGLLTGAVVGIPGAGASAPLRRLAGVSDRAVVNGISIIGGALVLWLVVGILHTTQRNAPVRAQKAVVTAIVTVAAAGTILLYTVLENFADRLPSLAEPELLWVSLAGIPVFLALAARRVHLPLRLATAGAVCAAVATAAAVSALDRAPAVHYSLSKLPAAPATRLSAVTTSAAATAAASAAAVSGPVHFIVASGSEAAFTVHEKLTQLPSPSDAIGKTQSISGNVYLDPGIGLDQSQPSTITVDLSTLTSDSAMRDNFIKRSTLQTAQYPKASFTITGITGFPTTYTEGDQVNVTITGTMQVHGVQNPVTWTGAAQYAGGKLEIVAATDITMTEFGMAPPQVPVVQSVDDKVHLDLHALLQEQNS